MEISTGLVVAEASKTLAATGEVSTATGLADTMEVPMRARAAREKVFIVDLGRSKKRPMELLC